VSRKNAIASFATGAAALLGAAAAPAVVFADEAAAPPAVPDGPPNDWGLTKQYYPVRRLF